MRRATHDTQWMLGEAGDLQGLALGFDFCAEHEASTENLRATFGLPRGIPIGLSDRKITQLPSTLVYGEFDRRPRDKRRKAQRCAVLASPNWPRSLEQIVANEELGFFSEPGDSWHKESHDLATSWSTCDFAILVRSAQNIARLAELHAAFQAKDILFGAGLAGGYAAHRGLTFVIDSRVSDETRQSVLKADLAYKELEEAISASGIKAQLLAAKKRYFVLKGDWADESKTSLKFWLNPVDGTAHNCGYFSLEDLRAWARNEGPVVKTGSVKAA